jgi:hypothetical protein
LRLHILAFDNRRVAGKAIRHSAIFLVDRR